jgi:hypothetical protein
MKVLIKAATLRMKIPKAAAIFYFIPCKISAEHEMPSSYI